MSGVSVLQKMSRPVNVDILATEVVGVYLELCIMVVPFFFLARDIFGKTYLNLKMEDVAVPLVIPLSKII
jgi:hypothetical protein